MTTTQQRTTLRSKMAFLNISTTTVAAGSEPDSNMAASENNNNNNTYLNPTPIKLKKLSRKASSMKLVPTSSSHEKISGSSAPTSTTTTTTTTSSATKDTPTMPITIPKERKSSSSSFFSYFFRPFRSQKAAPVKKQPHTTALEQTEFSPATRKDSKIDSGFSINKAPSVPSTPNPARFSQALFIPPTEPMPSQVAVSRRSSSDNPCLFIAFEQAIKSGSLTAPSIPPELILKYHQENEARFQRERRSRFARKSSLSKSLDVGWTQKLFILAPGMLLQYGGDGSYDREPERVLRLRADSLAFATDVFEGKHFVLQVSSGSDLAPLSPDERRPSLMSRFGSKSRLDAYVMLLIFDGSEEMQDWLVKIRKEISRLGGPSIEEHPQPASKANTIIFNDDDDCFSRTPTYRRSLDSTRKDSTGGRKSDEIAASMSTVMSQDGIILDSLRTNSNNSLMSRERRSQGSLDTSPERSSIPDTTRDTRERRRSTATSHSYSSTDLRLKSGPGFVPDQFSSSERPPSPTLTQVSTSSFAGRRSRGALPAPIPIPVPSIPKRHASTASYVGDLPTPDIVNRRRRTRKSSAPPSPDRMITLLSTSLPNPTSPDALSNRRQRPVSLASAPVTPGKDSRNMKRRSLGALSSAAHGPPLHPPPSTPLPKLPDGTMGNFPRVSVSLYSPHSSGIPPVPQIPIPIPHSPLALHSQSAADISPISRKHSNLSLSSRA